MEPRTAAKHLTSPKLHRALPYLFLILAGLHLGLHWRGLWQRFTRFCQWNTASPVYRALSWGFAVGIVGIGLYGSFANRLGDRILMKHIFATPALQSGAPLYVLLLFGVIVLYAAIATMAEGWLARRK